MKGSEEAPQGGSFRSLLPTLPKSTSDTGKVWRREQCVEALPKVSVMENVGGKVKMERATDRPILKMLRGRSSLCWPHDDHKVFATSAHLLHVRPLPMSGCFPEAALPYSDTGTETPYSPPMYTTPRDPGILVPPLQFPLHTCVIVTGSRGPAPHTSSARQVAH